MKRRKNKINIVVLLVLVNIILTACAGKEIEKSSVSYTYNKRIESVTIKNKIDSNVYVDYEVMLLDKDNKILYVEEYNKASLGENSEESINMEDIKPDYIEYERIDKMDVKIDKVYEISILKTIILAIIVVFGIIGAICIIIVVIDSIF